MAKPIIVQKIEDQIDPQELNEALINKPNIYISTDEPTSSIGQAGDLWAVYEE